MGLVFVQSLVDLYLNLLLAVIMLAFLKTIGLYTYAIVY